MLQHLLQILLIYRGCMDSENYPISFLCFQEQDKQLIIRKLLQELRQQCQKSAMQLLQTCPRVFLKQFQSVLLSKDASHKDQDYRHQKSKICNKSNFHEKLFLEIQHKINQSLKNNRRQNQNQLKDNKTIAKVVEKSLKMCIQDQFNCERVMKRINTSVIFQQKLSIFEQQYNKIKNVCENIHYLLRNNQSKFQEKAKVHQYQNIDNNLQRQEGTNFRKYNKDRNSIKRAKHQIKSQTKPHKLIYPVYQLELYQRNLSIQNPQHQMENGQTLQREYSMDNNFRKTNFKHQKLSRNQYNSHLKNRPVQSQFARNIHYRNNGMSEKESTHLGSNRRQFIHLNLKKLPKDFFQNNHGQFDVRRPTKIKIVLQRK